MFSSAVGVGGRGNVRERTAVDHERLSAES